MRTMRSYLADFLIKETHGWEIVQAVREFERKFLYSPVSSLTLRDCDSTTLCEIYADLKTYLDSLSDLEKGVYVDLARQQPLVYSQLVHEKCILFRSRDEAA